MYGAGVLESIVQRKIDGVERDYYMMKLPNRSMVVMIPTEHSEDIGVRPVVDANQADQVMAAIPSIQAEMTSNWNRRYRENMERLKSGDLFQVAWVIKGLIGQGPLEGAVHWGAENASLGSADADLRDRALQESKLRDSGGAVGYCAGIVCPAQT